MIVVKGVKQNEKLKNPYFTKYTKDSLMTDIEKSILEYERMHNTKSTGIKIGKIVLPKVVLKNGKELDLNKLVREKGGQCVMVKGGTIIGVLYLQEKNNKKGAYLHIFKIPMDIVKPVGNDTTYYFVKSGKLNTILDERGLSEK